ncbi:MAG: FliA/WhiG family RNA polymerase sigma factor [Desulfobacterales bacterium]|uniref:RNA polymerase sigma factor n=1 Tax=Candidatus Desulfatibia profunda TaxID=2841695 RepID=A0A8J6TIU3_9BACT|nr:FliA/WhiG family RNA polymerase sigma factor [Candidatus Desulfatibia profunda]MBL7179783.1 FliA/WhiG family RNA polymerase sigma factor [Desulfobacterales bacterium]MBL7208430.1 FliA/WhiG family RNA polymerase sigma factor [Desulfobacterales bacterium]
MKAGVGRYQQFIRIDQENVDKKSREELILEYAPLVKAIVERIAMRLPPNISKDELISGGIMGLFDALDKFDPGKGTKFRTYATLRIKGAIIDELRRMDWVSRSVRRDIHKIEAARRTLEMKLGREPEDFEIAEEMGVDADSYHRMTTRAQGIGLFSLDAELPDCFSLAITSQTPEVAHPLNEVRIKELKKVIAKTLSKLSKKEQLVMSLYYFDELTLKEIAQVLDLTESRISQIHSKAIIKLRVKLRSYYEG